MADSQRKTANLLDFNALKTAPAGQMPDSSAFTFEHLLILTLNPNTTYTLSSTGTGSTSGDADANRSLYYGGVSADYVVYSGHSCSYTTGDDGKVYIGFLSSRSNAQQYLDGTATIMLNEGSQPKPYEPYSSTGWLHSLRKLTTATEAIENPLYSDGTAITAYTLKGNTVQSGTPTPSNPVAVTGVGNKTANLLDYTYIISTNFVTVTQIPNGVNLSGNFYAKININLEIGNTYYMSWNLETISGSPYVAWRVHYTDNTYSPYIFSGNGYTIEKEISEVLFYVTGSSSTASANITNIMLNSGSTALPYEPYGYKIPILNGQQTIDIYIGDLPLLKSLDGTAVDEISNGTLTRRVDSDGSVLPTPTTTQITMPSIPTTEGANTITVDTTVQPSEFTATWTGWHDSSVKEYDGSQWQ